MSGGYLPSALQSSTHWANKKRCRGHTATAFSQMEYESEAKLLGIGQGGNNTFLVNGAQTVGRHFYSDPLVLSFEKELLLEEVRIEFPLGLPIGVGNIVPHHHLLSCYFANP